MVRSSLGVSWPSCTINVPLICFACVVLQHQSDGYLIIIQPKKVEVAEIQASLLSKAEYKQFRAISSRANATSNALNEGAAQSNGLTEDAATANGLDEGASQPASAETLQCVEEEPKSKVMPTQT